VFQVQWKRKVLSNFLLYLFMSIFQYIVSLLWHLYISPSSLVACHVGDWVEVACDYTPGVCSEGGTGVVVATVGGTPSPIFLSVSYH
jgi:hypothetical protein